MYYDIKVLMGHDALFNFVVGSRGVGKTYSSKRMVINNFLKRGEQFIYVRRYKNELKNIKKFFIDVSVEFPNVKFDVKGRDLYINDKVAGYALPLSTAKIDKGVAAFPDVTTIIFDEFILDKGVYHYIADEVTNFLELYETIARMRRVRVFFLSNAVTIHNPYFLFFNIKIPRNKEFFRDGSILLHMVNAGEYAIEKKKTEFGRLIANTPYGNYNIDNQFLRDNDNFIERKTPHSAYFFTMVYDGDTFGVWIDYTFGVITVSNDVDNSYPVIYAFTTPDHRENTLLVNMRDYRIATFKKQFFLGNVRFENPRIKGKVMELVRGWK